MTRELSFFQELIGKKIEVVNSTNKQLIGLSGLVVDETKSTLTILVDEKRQVLLLKAVVTFRLEETGVVISGADIVRRPEERLKQ